MTVPAVHGPLLALEQAKTDGILAIDERAARLAYAAREILRETLACKLEDAGWPSVAADAREGVHPETILARLHSIGEGYSDAADIVAERC